MTYSLNTLNNTQSSDEPSATERFIQEVALVLGGLALVFWVLSLLSYTSNDAAWSTTGLGTVTQNWVGRIGKCGGFELLLFWLLNLVVYRSACQCLAGVASLLDAPRKDVSDIFE
jgi:4TM region of DNA translocase FtsK/SpoIIIE